MPDFIFVRHGQSQANADKMIANPDSPLTESGIEQARATGEAIKELNITMIVTSPFPRAMQTAEIIANELGIEKSKIKTIDELKERGLGELEGKPKDKESNWYLFADSEFGIEPSEVLFERMSKCLRKIKRLSKKEHVLAVGHGVSGFYLLQVAAKKKSVKEFDPSLQISNAVVLKVNL